MRIEKMDARRIVERFRRQGLRLSMTPIVSAGPALAQVTPQEPVATTAAAPADSAAEASQNLRDVNIEALLSVSIRHVFGASERLQPVTEAPSSVTIITADDIHRYGYQSLADILRGVRGFYISDDRNYSYVGVRRFDRPGDYSSRVLLLINGHKVNDSVYDQAYVGTELALDMATYERSHGLERGRRRKDVPTASFATLFNSQDPREQTTDRRTMVDAQYSRLVGHTHIAADLSFDRLHYNGTYPWGADNPEVPVLFDQHYSDPASDEHLPDTIPQNGTTARIGFRWTLGTQSR